MNYIVFDLEATCEDRSIDANFDNEIIEIGAVKIKDKKIIDKFSIFVKPIENSKLTIFCKELTSIKQEDVDNGYSFTEAIEMFYNWASDNGKEEVLFASWGYYDKKQIEKDCLRHSIENTYIKRHISIKHQYSEEVLKVKKYFGIKKALRKEGLTFEGTHHRGIDDATNIAKIFIKHFNRWKY